MFFPVKISSSLATILILVIIPIEIQQIGVKALAGPNFRLYNEVMAEIMKPSELETRLAQVLPTVQKPGRYTGGELNQVVKDWEAVKARVALVFPDIYDLGMSNLGLSILYDLLNQRPDVLAERAFAPWIDMEDALRAAEIPLYSLETKHPLAAFDVIGFSLPYETLYTNTLNLLDLAGIPLFSAERTSKDPLIVAGGHAAFNPEPMHAFIDAFVIGEGEEVMGEIVDLYLAWRDSGAPRERTAARAVPSLGGVRPIPVRSQTINADGTFSRLDKSGPRCPAASRKADRAGPAATNHPLCGPLCQRGPQPHPDRDHARLHPGLPVLPRRHGHPARTRAACGGGARRD